jgi:hypothetical protein
VITAQALQEIQKQARERYNAMCMLGGFDLPDDAVDAMQFKLMRWQREMFGLPSDEWMALGIVEESGEGFDGQNAEAAFDALGDVIVYAGQLAMCNRLAIGPVLALADAIYGKDREAQIVAVGALCHSVLKRSQNIREERDVEVYRAKLVEHLAKVIAHAMFTVEVFADVRPDPAKVYLTVGAEVLERKRGDKMIPATAPATAPAPDPAAARRDRAMSDLAKANEDLGEAERVEGPGDFTMEPAK